MSDITQLDLAHVSCDDKYNGVLKAISENMRDIASLNISNFTIDATDIDYLLPTEDNPGCPKLKHLVAYRVQSINEKIIRKIIISLPKLQSLKHELMFNALVEFSAEDLGVDTALCLTQLCGTVSLTNDDGVPIHDGVLMDSPVFPRLCNVTSVFLILNTQSERLVLDLLMSLPNLCSIDLYYVSHSHKMLPLLKSIGKRLKRLELHGLVGNLSVGNVIETCPNLVRLSLFYMKNNISNSLEVDSSNEHHVLCSLEHLTLVNLDEKLCNENMLISLLRAPCLKNVGFSNVEVMSDNVILTALSTSHLSCAPLSKLNELVVMGCSSITSAPFLCLLAKANCVVETISLVQCQKFDYEILQVGAKKYTRPLTIVKLD